MSDDSVNREILAIWKIESASLVAGLARTVGDIALAEDLAQDALVAALENWPRTGVPQRPGGWLMLTAKRRALDLFRRRKMLDRKHEELAREIDAEQDERPGQADATLDDDIGDDVLKLIFTACHPILPAEARVALSLRLLCGLTTGEIARAFLISESNAAQRIVRAKRSLSDSGIAFEIPHGEQRTERLAAVLETIYLVFNEGYSATAGESWVRPQLCNEAMRLGRTLASLAPHEPEVHGLLALMELQASRLAARVGKDGEIILLLDQDRSRWDSLLIHRGLEALARAEAESRGEPAASYALQAAIAACYARAPSGEETDWRKIASLYEALNAVSPSPLVELNRAVAVSMAEGPAAGLEIIDRLTSEPGLNSYHLLPSVRGDLLMKLGRLSDARIEFERAAQLTRNSRERALLLSRAESCSGASQSH